MKNKTFYLTTTAIFSAIAILHLLRIFYGWHAVIGGWIVPMWLSWVAIVVAGYLVYIGFKLGKK